MRLVEEVAVVSLLDASSTSSLIEPDVSFVRSFVRRSFRTAILHNEIQEWPLTIFSFLGIRLLSLSVSLVEVGCEGEGRGKPRNET